MESAFLTTIRPWRTTKQRVAAYYFHFPRYHFSGLISSIILIGIGIVSVSLSRQRRRWPTLSSKVETQLTERRCMHSLLFFFLHRCCYFRFRYDDERIVHEKGKSELIAWWGCTLCDVCMSKPQWDHFVWLSHRRNEFLFGNFTVNTWFLKVSGIKTFLVQCLVLHKFYSTLEEWH